MYEYQVIRTTSIENTEITLNDLGKEGWEAYAVIFDPEGLLHFLKRKL